MPTNVILNFRRLVQTDSQNVILNFGNLAGTPDLGNVLYIRATLPSLQLSVHLGYRPLRTLSAALVLPSLQAHFILDSHTPAQATISIVMPSLRASVRLKYSVDNKPFITSSFSQPNKNATLVLVELNKVDWGIGVKTNANYRDRYEDCSLLEASTIITAENGQSLTTSKSVVFEQAGVLETGKMEFGFKQLSLSRIDVASPFQQGGPIATNPLAMHMLNLHLFPKSWKMEWAVAKLLERGETLLQSIAQHLNSSDRIPWHKARYPNWGKSIAPTKPPINDSHLGDPDLNFCQFKIQGDTLHVILNFGNNTCQSNFIPEKNWYYIMNTFSMYRVDNGTIINCTACEMSIDQTNWCWGLSATLSDTELSKFVPDSNGMVEIQVNLSGQLFNFLVEGYTETRKFGVKSYVIRGRSPTAYLDEPLAPKRSYSQTSPTRTVQLAQAELDRSFTDTVLNWKVIDPTGWNVPANTWAYQSLSPIKAIQDIAGSVGAIIYTDPTLPQLSVLSLYPVMPWETPSYAVSIPETVIRNTSLDWKQTPQYNGVYLYGSKVGTTAFCRVLGTAGDVLGVQQSHDLLTENAAFRERGRAILGAVGKQALVSLEMPYMDNIGIIEMRQPIQIRQSVSVSWWGYLTNMDIRVAVDKEGLVTTSYTMVLERHYL